MFYCDTFSLRSNMDNAIRLFSFWRFRLFFVQFAPLSPFYRYPLSLAFGRLIGSHRVFFFPFWRSALFFVMLVHPPFLWFILCRRFPSHKRQVPSWIHSLLATSVFTFYFSSEAPSLLYADFYLYARVLFPRVFSFFPFFFRCEACSGSRS